MRVSQYFLPSLKEVPADAKIASHRLMLRAGMIRQVVSGIYVWLPLGLKVLKKIENIIIEEINKTGAIEILMPTLQPASLWQESGRYDSYGKEMLRIKDRHDNDLLYGPTNEEVVTDIFRKYIKSYKDLPLNLYQIQWKFRDEIRPRFGVMRGREFFMKDGYSFDIDKQSAKIAYEKMFSAYIKIFKKLGLKAIPVRADNGAIGGDLSHEFQILAETGESALYYDKKFEELFDAKDDINLSDVESLYAAADEMHDEENCPVEKGNLLAKRGIEVGHIFNFGDKYSKAMNVYVDTADAKRVHPNMGSYGIGVSRLVGAIIEASHDENGIIWPDSVAPFKLAIISLKPEDEHVKAIAEKLYTDALAKNIDVIYDETKNSAGKKFANMELIGVPVQIIVGPKLAADGKVEIKYRKTGEKKEVSLENINLIEL